MLSLRGARAGGMLGTGARVGAVVTLGVLLASVVIDGARPTPQWLCDKVMEAIAMDDTMDADEFECKGVRPARLRPETSRRLTAKDGIFRRCGGGINRDAYPASPMTRNYQIRTPTRSERDRERRGNPGIARSGRFCGGVAGWRWGLS